MSALWMPTVIEAAVRSTALLGLAAVLAFVLRHRSAALRHLVWTLALAGGLVLPLAGALMPAVPFPVPAAVAAVLPTHVPGPAVAVSTFDGPPAVATRVAPQTSGSITPAPSTSTRSTPAPPPTPMASEAGRRTPPPGPAPGPQPKIGLGSMLFGVWLLGAAAFLARSLVGVLGMQRLSRHSSAVTRGGVLALLHDGCARLDIQRPVRLLVSRRAVIPMTWGWRRPVVLLPAASSDWSTERQTVVLQHELAHVRRADVVTQLIAQVVCAIYWFNPMVWIGAYRLRVERERACDDEVLRMGTRPSVYAGHLLEIAGAFRAPALSAPAAVAMAKRSQLEGRLLAILDPTARRAFPRAAAMVAVVTLSGAAVVVSAVTPTTRTERAVARTETVVDVATTERRAHVGEVDSTLPRAARATAITGRPVAPDGAPIASARPATGLAAPPAPAGEPVVGQGDEVASQSHSSSRSWSRSRSRSWSSSGAAVATGAEQTAQQRASIEAQTEARSPAEEARERALREVERAWEGVDADALYRYYEQSYERAFGQWDWSDGQWNWTDNDWSDAFQFDFSSGQDQHDHDPETRRALEPRLVEAFIGALSDSDAEVRERAAQALGRHRVGDAVAALGMALGDEAAEVRERAAWALGRIRDAEAVPALGRALDDAEPDVREQAAWALGRIRDAQAVPALGRALDDAEPDVRQQAAWALGMIRDAEAVPPLVGGLRDPDQEVREQAAWALGMIRSPASVEGLVAALRDSEVETQEQVAWALSRIRDERAVDGLITAVDLVEGEALEEVVEALGRIGGDQAMDALVGLMDSSNPEVRREVIEALSRGSRRGPNPNPSPNPNPNPNRR